MTKEEALSIIQLEQLTHFNWFNDHLIKEDEVGIREINGKLNVYSSDERANLISEKFFNTESEALENFIKRLRALNKFNQLYK